MTTRRRTEPDRILLDFPHAARWLDMSRPALRARVRRRQIPFIKVGRRIYFNIDQLRSWIAERTQSAALLRLDVRALDSWIDALAPVNSKGDIR
jgi:hypothetical protein